MVENSKSHSAGFELSNDTSSFLIDKGGKVIALSDSAKKMFPSATPNTNFFELFDEDNFSIVQKVFIDARRTDRGADAELYLAIDKKIESYIVVISPLKSENNTYFVVSFESKNKSTRISDVNNIWIATELIEELASDKKIIQLINKVKQSFPFSFIEKAKIQKEINEFGEFFWIKENDGKYVLVNEKYADWLNTKPIQLENKNESDVLPKPLYQLLSTVSNYINESKNIVVIENISNQLIGRKEEKLSLIQFPLCDIDNNTVAIIGFTQIANTAASRLHERTSFVYPSIKNIPIPIIIVGTDNRINLFNHDFLSAFHFNERIDLAGQDLSKVFEKGFLNIYESFIRAEEKEIVFSYTFEEKANITVEARISKLYDIENQVRGVQIVLKQQKSENSEIESKARMYDALIQYTPEAMFIYAVENLKFLEVNEQALKLYGYKRSDFLNMDLTDLYAPEDIQTLIESGDSRLGTGNYSGPWKHKTSDGNTVLVELSRTNIEFMGKAGHLNIVRNITDKLEEKRKLQILESVYENAADPIIRTDKEGFITEINEVVTKKLGYSKKDLEAVPFITLLSDDFRAVINRNVFQSGLIKPTSQEIEIKKSAGSFQKATLISTPVKSYGGEVDSFNLIIKLIEETVVSKDLAHTQDHIIGKVDPPFLSNIFHEILTPINVILGFTQELEESIDNPNHEQKEALDIIKENQKLLLQIMDNAVEYSTLEQKIIKFKSEPVKFVDIINEIKENIKKVSEAKKVEFSLGRISSTLTIETDKQKLLSLISLFLNFAIQITKDETLILSANAIDDLTCAVSIKDSKDKISSYLQKSIAEVFSEDEGMSRRNYGFSRFSVKLAKKLIELLSVKKETIMKDGEVNEYALIIPLKFIVPENQDMQIEAVPQTVSKPEQIKRIPVSDLSKTFIEDVPSIAVTQPKTSSKSVNLSELTCLYLEDQVDSQILFKVQMKDLKSIEFCPSFESALPLLKTKKFDFIVMDINLQGEYNGLDALRIIQKMPGYRDIPIIASTAYVQSHARDSFIAAGFSEFVSKPLLRDKLLEALKKFF